MKELRSEITIHAPAERIWDELTGLESFQEWNPFMRRANGNVEVGEGACKPIGALLAR